MWFSNLEMTDKLGTVNFPSIPVCADLRRAARIEKRIRNSIMITRGSFSFMSDLHCGAQKLLPGKDDVPCNVP